jgi:hypothetical protein
MNTTTGVPRRRPRRFRDVHPSRRGLVLAWWTFTATFALMRLLTWAIKVHLAGLGNVSVGGTHLHHFLWGILVVAAVGFVGLLERSHRWRAWMGAAFGIGLALIVDEIALLVELRDVYWSGEGQASIGVAILIVGISGSALALTRSPHVDDAAELPRRL